MSDNMTMEDVYAKMTKARNKKLEARQEQDEGKKQKMKDRRRRQDGSKNNWGT
jgi:hypothetical protein